MSGSGADTSDDVVLRPVLASDWDTIRTWLRLPEVQAWWGTAASTEAEVRMVLETPSAMPRLVIAGSEPIGYVHAIDALYWGSGLPDGMLAGTWDIDAFIAAPGWRGRGAGRRAVELMAGEVFETTLAPAVSIFTSIANESTIRAHERAGFHWVRVHNDPIQGPCWMMIKERPAR